MSKFLNIEIPEESANRLAMEADLSDLTMKQFLIQAIAMYTVYSGQRRELACEFPEGADLSFVLFIEATDTDTGASSRVGMVNSWDA